MLERNAMVRFQRNSAAVKEAREGVVTYVRLLKLHPSHHSNVQACRKAQNLAGRLERNFDADKANPESVASLLRSLGADDSLRPLLREYKNALDVCRRECIEEQKLNELAAKLKRNLNADLADSESASHLLADLRSLNESMNKQGSESWFTNRDRWRALRATLKIFGWL